MALNNQQIFDFFLKNPNLQDVQIAAWMRQNKVTPTQVSQAVGVPLADIEARYNRALPFINPNIEARTIDQGESTRIEYYIKGTDIQVDAPTFTEVAPTTGLTESSAPEYQANNITIYDPQAKGEYVYSPQGELIGFNPGERSTSIGGFLNEVYKDNKNVINSALLFGALDAAGLLGGGATGTTAGTVGTTTGTTAGTASGLGAGSSLGTGLTAGASGLGLNAAGTAGLGTLGTGAGITAGTGLGTGVLAGSTLGTGLLGTAAGAAGLTGTGILSGSNLGTSLLGTTGTGALTGTGVLTGSNLGTSLLGTGTGTATTVGGLGNTVANLGTGALTTGLEGLSTGLTGLGTGLGTGLNAGLSNLGTGLTNSALSNLISTGLTTGAGLLQQQTSKEAAQRAQARIDAETAAAKQAAAFRPVGMTTRFGTSEFKVDPVTGQITSAGYTLSPEAKAAQDRLVNLAGAGLTQAEAAQQQFAPLQTGAQNLFTLGNQYIAQSPEQVAQNYLNQQMALLQPGRELELANLQNKLQQQGRGGLSVAQGGTYGATTPELQALYNARAMQEAQLAAQAQQAGQQQVAFGAGLLGTGAQTMGNYYAGQQAAYAPYTTALGQVQALEAAGQQPLTMGAQLGQTAATAGANVGRLGLAGAEQSVALATGQAATNNPYASLLGGLGASPAFGTAAGSALTSLFG